MVNKRLKSVIERWRKAGLDDRVGGLRIDQRREVRKPREDEATVRGDGHEQVARRNR